MFNDNINYDNPITCCSGIGVKILNMCYFKQ
jgi:hypothetical protein